MRKSTHSLGCSATQSTPITTRFRRGSKCGKAFSPRSETGPVAAAASGPISAMVKGSYSGPPLTLGNAASTRFRLIARCRPFGEPRLRRASRLRREPHGFARCWECRYQVEPATASPRAAEGGTSADPAAKLLMEPSQMASPAEMARRYGPETPVPDLPERLVRSRCGSHDVDMVVTGERR